MLKLLSSIDLLIMLLKDRLTTCVYFLTKHYISPVKLYKKTRRFIGNQHIIADIVKI